MNDTPLIYTTRGNVPLADLHFQPEWQLFAAGQLVWSSLTDGAAPV